MLIYEPQGRAREYAERALNLYTGCSHGCIYCWAPDVIKKNRETFNKEVEPRINIIAKLEEELRKTKIYPKEVLLSFTSDPYQPLELTLRITRNVISILHNYDIGVHILTKAGTRATRDFDILGQNPNDAFASTLTFIDESQSLEWEPKAALPEDRIKAIRQAKEKGIRTWVSLEPVIDPEQSLEIIRQTKDFVDKYKVGKLNYHKREKEINWTRFAKEAIALLKKYNKDYYIKKDLLAYLS